MVGWMDTWMGFHITKEVVLVCAVAVVFVCVTFLRPRQPAKHTPSVPVIYWLAIDILQSQLGGDQHAHGSIIHGDA